MKVAYDTRFCTPRAAAPPPSAVTADARDDAPALWEEPAATLELSWDAARAKGEKDPFRERFDLTKKTDKAKEASAQKSPGPQDVSGMLTRRLVASGSQGEVRAIIAEAYQSLSDWLTAAMGGGPDANKAWGVIKRLNKLIRRAQRKVSDLTKEDMLRVKQKRAEKERQHLHAKQIRQELYRRIQERKLREKRYLRDAHPHKEQKGGGPDLSPAALQEKINALATGLSQLTSPPPAAAAPDGGGGEAASAEPPGTEAAAEA